MTPTLASLHVYPLKSCAPLALDAGTVEARGLAHDRRWLVTDANGRFLTGREHPRLTLIRALPDGDDLRLAAPGCDDLRLTSPTEGHRVAVRIWKSEVEALSGGADADAWISAFLGTPARLFHMDEACRRAVDPDYSKPGDVLSFADGYPLLLISQAALDDLNTRLARPVSMLRFRPNVVIAGTTPHAEDAWKRVRIGDIEFDVVKRCIRCVFTTVDFEHGEFDPDGEPLRTLIGYRRTDKGVSFGQNLIPRGRGTLRVGDAVEVVA